jgi:hypothetical protein
MGYLLRELNRTSRHSTGFGTVDRLGEPWNVILRDAHVFLYYRPADEFDYSMREVVRIYKSLIWKGAYNEIFDFIQFTMRHRDCPLGACASFVTFLIGKGRAAGMISE